MNVWWSDENYTTTDECLHELCETRGCYGEIITENEALVRIKNQLAIGMNPNMWELMFNYQTPLHSLICGKNLSVGFLSEVTASLLVAGANPNLIDEVGYSPLHLMVECLTCDTISTVLCTLPRNHPILSILDVKGGTLLHAAANSRYDNRVAVVEYLVKAGLGVNITDSCGRTALHYACYPRSGKNVVWDAAVVSCLLDLGADILATDNAGRIPLHYLFILQSDDYSNNNEVIKFLCSDYPDIETADKIARILLQGNSNLLKYLDKQGRCPLYYCSFWEELVELFSAEDKHDPEVDKCRIFPSRLKDTLALCFYSCSEEMNCSFPYLLFKTQGEIKWSYGNEERDMRNLSLWIEKSRRRYPDPDILVARIFNTPGVGPPTLLEESKEIHRQMDQLIRRLTVNTKGIYPGIQDVELVGSCREGTKTALPDEFDFRVKVKLPQQCEARIKYRGTDDTGDDNYIIWLCYLDEYGMCFSNDGETGVDTHTLMADFVKAVLRSLSDSRSWDGLSLNLRRVEWGRKAFTLSLEWTGVYLFQMHISVDLVLVLKLHSNSVRFTPHRNKSNIDSKFPSELDIVGWHVLCTRERVTQMSFSDIDCAIMHNIPDVIRRGFTLCKTMTLQTLTPGWGDSDNYKPTSYMLKMSLFDLLDPDRSYFLLDPCKCSAKLSGGDFSLSMGGVREWAVRIFRNLRQQLKQTLDYEIQESKLRCYLLQNSTLVNKSNHVMSFCDALIRLLGEEQPTQKGIERETDTSAEDGGTDSSWVTTDSSSDSDKDADESKAVTDYAVEKTTCLSLFPELGHKRKNCLALTCLSFALEQILPQRHVMPEETTIKNIEEISSQVEERFMLSPGLEAFYSHLLFDDLAYPILVPREDCSRGDMLEMRDDTARPPTPVNDCTIILFRKYWDVALKEDNSKDATFQVVTEFEQNTQPGNFKLRLSGTKDYVSGQCITQQCVVSRKPIYTDTETVLITPARVLFGYRCRTWPENLTTKWQHQASQSTWPGQSVIDRIIAQGCHVIPVDTTYPASPIASTKWQFNFANAERILASTLTIAQRQCFMLVSLVVDHFLQAPSILTPSLIKSLFFKLCENIEIEKWEQEDGVGFGFLSFFSEMNKAFIDENMPCYFVREVNLLHDVPRESIQSLKYRLHEFRTNPLQELMNIFDFLHFHFSTPQINALNGLQTIQNHVVHCESGLPLVRKTFLSLVEELSIINLLEDRMFESIGNMFDFKDLCFKYFQEEANVSGILETVTTDFSPERLAKIYETYLQLAAGRESLDIVTGNLACAYYACAHSLKVGTPKHQDYIRKADETFQTAIALLQTNMSAKCDYAMFLVQQKRCEEATDVFCEIIKADKEMRYVNAFYMRDINGFDKNLSAEISSGGELSCPSFVFACYYLIQIYQQNRRDDSVSSVLNVFEETCWNIDAQTASQCPQMFSLLGYSYQLVKRHEKARQCFARALEIASNYEQAKQNIEILDRQLDIGS